MGFFSRFKKQDDDPNIWLDLREEHYTKFFGSLDETIIHPSNEMSVHVDVYRVQPSNERPYWTLITGGMSDARQNIPKEATAISGRTEIMMYVPEPQPWFYNELIWLGEMPFKQKTFLHWYHTAPRESLHEVEPTKLTYFYFLPPYFENEEFDSLKIEGDKVDILWAIPITRREREYAVKNGGRELEEVFVKAELDPVFDEKRKSLV
jgi:hypothetical protein